MRYISNNNFVEPKERIRNKNDLEKYRYIQTLEYIKKQKIKESNKIKLEEIAYVKDRYSLYKHQDEVLIRFYLTYINIPSNSLIKVTKLLDSILKYIYRYTDEEICDFIRRDLIILKSSYNTFKKRLIIFNHFGLLNEALFNGKHYLSIHSNYDSCDIYAMLKTYNITSISDLQHFLETTSESSMEKLRKKNPLTKEIIDEFEDEFLKKLKKESFKYEYEQRRLTKNKRNGN